MQVTILKEDLVKIVRGILPGRQLIAPTTLPNGDLLYSHVRSADEVSLDTGRVPIMSAKEFFFSSEEELFGFEIENYKDIKFTAPPEPEERIFLGIRSCDLKGVRFLEQFFRKSYNDTTVTSKIEKTLFISVGCGVPAEQCFCVCCDGGPFLLEGADAQLIDLGNRFFVDFFTRKGEELFAVQKMLLKPATPRDIEEKAAVIGKVDRTFTRRSYMAMGVKNTSLNTVPAEVWEQFDSRCISCGSCAYVCPTCSCFNVFDRRAGKGGTRIRSWDSCSYSGFTREVSGHNPRPTAGDRLKQRFFHKLSYQCLQSNGRLGCVGCGRCAASCPSVTDISSFVTTIRQAKREKSDE